MNIGKMDRRITLLKTVKNPDRQGGRSTTYEPVATVWAEFRKPKMVIGENAGAIVSEMTQEIVIRYRTDVRRGWRVALGDRIFEVIHPPYDYKRATTTLVCREVVR